MSGQQCKTGRADPENIGPSVRLPKASILLGSRKAFRGIQEVISLGALLIFPHGLRIDQTNGLFPVQNDIFRFDIPEDNRFLHMVERVDQMAELDHPVRAYLLTGTAAAAQQLVEGFALEPVFGHKDQAVLFYDLKNPLHEQLVFPDLSGNIQDRVELAVKNIFIYSPDGPGLPAAQAPAPVDPDRAMVCQQGLQLIAAADPEAGTQFVEKGFAVFRIAPVPDRLRLLLYGSAQTLQHPFRHLAAVMKRPVDRKGRRQLLPAQAGPDPDSDACLPPVLFPMQPLPAEMGRGRGGLLPAAGHIWDAEDQKRGLLRNLFIPCRVQQKAGGTRFLKSCHDTAPFLQSQRRLFSDFSQADNTYILYLLF